MSAPKTVRVRIAVAIDARGRWEALGSSTYGAREIGQIVVENHANEGGSDEDTPEPAVVWVEAEVPLPQVVDGEVVG